MHLPEHPLARRLALCALPLALLPPPAAAGEPPPPLMLARAYQGDIDPAGFFASEKLDGVRGYWTGTRLLTRAGHLIPAPEWFTAGWPEEPLDGELWIGRGRFEEVSAIARSDAAADARWRQVRFMVFDLPRSDGPFVARLARLERLLADGGLDHLQAVAQRRLADAGDLEAWLARVVAAGGEGLMLRRADAPYHHGRSDELLKVKTHDDAEARVIAAFPGQGRLQGMMGSLLVETPDGRRFRLGSGFSDAERRDPPSPGRWVTYRHNGLTGDGLPRFARFLRVRHEMPPPDTP